MILDLFAGPGGWSEGLRHLGLSDIGIEWDKSACATRAAAGGHLTIRADVAQYPTEPFVGRVTGLIASPPCQAWSMAGKRKGERDRLRCHELASDFAEGFDGDPLWGAGSVPDDWEDSHSHLVAQPVRWVRDLRPEWIALEQVPPVLVLWRHFAEIFRDWGYGCWTGILNAADFGVPQTRQRAILVAHRSRPALPPEPTHCRGGSPDGLFSAGLSPWVSMAEALGWGMTERPSFTATSGGTATGGAEVCGSRARRLVAAAKAEWVHERPATTIVGTFGRGKVVYPGHHTTSIYESGESVAITVEEASILQSFRPDYPWQGSKTKKFEQIGNAVPPRLAAHVIGALLGIEVSFEDADEVMAG